MNTVDYKFPITPFREVWDFYLRIEKKKKKLKVLQFYNFTQTQINKSDFFFSSSVW